MLSRPLAALPENTLTKPENHGATERELRPAAAQDLVLLASARETEEGFEMFDKVKATPGKGMSTISRLGNRETTTEEGVILEGKNGGPQDFLRDRLVELLETQPPKDTETTFTKFKDMMSAWRKMRADLNEGALLHEMGHDLAFCDFLKRLSQDSALRWVTYEAARSAAVSYTHLRAHET